MKKHSIAFVGMTHLGLVSAVAASEKGYEVVCFDPDIKLIEVLQRSEPPITEPLLIELMNKNQERLTFSCDPNKIRDCSIVYVSPDVSTDDFGQSDLSIINHLLNIVFEHTAKRNLVVILSQVPPGFTRSLLHEERTLYYQVETLIFGEAINRALNPERYIIGCKDPTVPLPSLFEQFLGAYNCPILPMRYESAELAKISINMCLVASITTANVLAEICEFTGADWSEITPALKLDKRIGKNAYLSPGLGISGGNLERDLATIVNIAEQNQVESTVVDSWIRNSKHRKNWIWNIFKRLDLDKKHDLRIAILGLTYKENTDSLKNSPALLLINNLIQHNVVAYDPMALREKIPKNIEFCDSMLKAIKGADVVVISTAWPEFRKLTSKILRANMSGNVVIDPYGLLVENDINQTKFSYYKLGKSM